MRASSGAAEQNKKKPGITTAADLDLIYPPKEIKKKTPCFQFPPVTAEEKNAAIPSKVLTEQQA